MQRVGRLENINHDKKLLGRTADEKSVRASCTRWRRTSPRAGVGGGNDRRALSSE
jgi:hypothetical protein